jgi:GTP-binding protein
VRREVEAFDPAMAARPSLIALNKIDLIEPAEAERIAASMRTATGLETWLISAQERIGLEPLVASLAAHLRQTAPAELACPS